MFDDFDDNNGSQNSVFISLFFLVISLALFVLTFVLIFWNESRLFSLSPSLEETKNKLVHIQCDQVNPGNEGKPVYITGDATTDELISDNVFPVTVNGFKLKRKVEMCQWVEREKTETKKKLGGGEEDVTTYTYTKEWCDSPVNSGNFKLPAEHENPAWDFEGGETTAKTGSLGAFTLTESIIGKMDWREAFKVEAPSVSEPQTPSTDSSEVSASLSENADDGSIESTPAIPESVVTKNDIPDGFIYYNGGFYKGNPNNLSVGDIRVLFEYTPSTVTISLISSQTGDSFTPFLSNAEPVELLEKGSVPPEKMLKNVHKVNLASVWIIRVLGIVMFFITMMLISYNWIITVMDFFLPDLSSTEKGMLKMALFPVMNCGTPVALTLLTIAIAWTYYNPLMVVSVLAAVIAIILLLLIVFLLLRHAIQKRQ